MTTYHKNYEHLENTQPALLMLTPSAFAKQSLFYIQEIGYFKNTGRCVTEREHLNSYLLVLSVSGEGELTYQDKKYILKSNDLFFIDCREYHRYRTTAKENWEFIGVHLNGNNAEDYFLHFSKQSRPVITPQNPNYMLDKLHTLIQIQMEKNFSAELFTSKLIVDLLTQILQSTYLLPYTNSDTVMEVTKVHQYLDHHYCERITLDSLAEMFRMNKFNLAKNFKKQIGFSPIDYLIKVRITAAQDLLKTNEMPVVDIAQSVGIPNTSHFINLFKEHIGETPLSFRKKWRTSS